MSWLQGFVLGLIQGLTEFLPVSSSGHLILAPKLFGWIDQGYTFDTVLHVGTLCALFWFFRMELIQLAKQVVQKNEFGKKGREFVIKVIVATMPALILAALLNDVLEAHARNATLVAVDLIIWATVLFAADRYAKPSQVKEDLQAVTWTQALTIGIAQPIALLPGSSRSGITITAGLFSGLSRAQAAKFSFFLSIPITAAAGLHGMLQVARHGSDGELLPLVIGFFTALFSGLLAIRILLRFVSKYRYDIFVFYRLALALLVLVLL